MAFELDFDPALFGLWPKAPVYCGGVEEDAELEDIARRVILETKAQAVSPLDALQDMLNAMTQELREQMLQFQKLRRLSDDRADAAGVEIDRKLIQADAKASIEAMSVIVRTLEKIDSLQRTIAHDRQTLAETTFDEASYNAFVAEVDQRVERRARELFAKYSASGGPGGPAACGAGATSDGTAPRGSPGGEGCPAPDGKERSSAISV
ncbi:hypothetical protein [Rhizobium sp. Root483D2]|uniref:hypothetical protein n=1 Tax=Rhizobium sp. Root483D2 TaxID=1736545 RepID=UPI000713E7D4|nr:hypothetical protein [Rhizobium sp. Root483D2]KQY28363.1 hypothetical protein ASD32_24645 [Rhizobium sp. Root483D2]